MRNPSLREQARCRHESRSVIERIKETGNVRAKRCIEGADPFDLLAFVRVVDTLLDQDRGAHPAHSIPENNDH
jgi:hypothetical protein